MPVVNVISTSVNNENISRFELLAWVNNCLQSNFTKIEEMATAAAYCQLTDVLFPGRVHLKKVKWNSRLEVDCINNWKILQTAWRDIGIDKPIPVQLLMKGKFQDNFEFLQWFRKFFDANYVDRSYDALKIRNYTDLPAALPSSLATKKRVRQSTNFQSHLSPSPSRFNSQANVKNNLTAKKIALNTKLAPVSTNNLKNITTRRSIAPTNSRTVGNTTKLPNVVNNNALKEEINNFKKTIDTLQTKLSEVTENAIAIEQENKFYYGKLRKLELMCDGLNPDENSIFVKDILQILYTTKTQFVELGAGDSTNCFNENEKSSSNDEKNSFNKKLNETFTAIEEKENLFENGSDLFNQTHSIQEKTLSFLSIENSAESNSKNNIFSDLILSHEKDLTNETLTNNNLSLVDNALLKNEDKKIDKKCREQKQQNNTEDCQNKITNNFKNYQNESKNDDSFVAIEDLPSPPRLDNSSF